MCHIVQTIDAFAVPIAGTFEVVFFSLFFLLLSAWTRDFAALLRYSSLDGLSFRFGLDTLSCVYLAGIRVFSGELDHILQHELLFPFAS